MSKRLRKILKISGLSYVALFIFSAAHLPATTAYFARNWNYGVLTMPLYSVPIARAYFNFLLHGTWPYGPRKDVVDLAAFIDKNSKRETFGFNVVPLDLTPEIPPGQEGRVNLDLGTENYESGFAGAFYGLHFGKVVTIGRHFCMFETMGLGDIFFGSLRCYEIVRRPNAQYVFQPIGTGKPVPLKLMER